MGGGGGGRGGVTDKSKLIIMEAKERTLQNRGVSGIDTSAMHESPTQRSISLTTPHFALPQTLNPEHLP